MAYSSDWVGQQPIKELSQPDWDVIVAGAGPAGCIAAQGFLPQSRTAALRIGTRGLRPVGFRRAYASKRERSIRTKDAISGWILVQYVVGRVNRNAVYMDFIM